MKSKYSFIVIFLCSSLLWAQDGYWSTESNTQVNSTSGNGIYNFDLVFSGTLQYTIENRESQEYSFSIHVNSADGTWLVDEPVALINGYNPSQDNRQFRFQMFYPDGTNRQYFFVTDADEGENPYQYIGAKNIASGSALQRDIVNADKFERFRLNATKTPAERHSVFGPQTKHRGNIDEQQITMHISNRHAPYSITPSVIGFLVGIFQDDIQQQNRYITYYESQNLKVKLNRVATERYSVDATSYDGMDIETYDPISESEEDTVNREALLDRFNNRTDEILTELSTIENLDIHQLLSFEMQLLGHNIQKTSLNQLSQVLSQGDINRLKSKYRQLMERSRACEAIPRYPEGPKKRCNDALGRSEMEFSQELQELGVQRF